MRRGRYLSCAALVCFFAAVSVFCSNYDANESEVAKREREIDVSISDRKLTVRETFFFLFTVVFIVANRLTLILLIVGVEGSC